MMIRSFVVECLRGRQIRDERTGNLVIIPLSQAPGMQVRVFVDEELIGPWDDEEEFKDALKYAAAHTAKKWLPRLHVVQHIREI